jgi:predicted transcriptional regulator
MHATTESNINHDVFNFILNEYIEEGYFLKRDDIVVQFNITVTACTQILRELQDTGSIVWDHYGIRPAVAEVWV